MNELRSILKVLGEENEKKLRDSITDLLIEQCENDLKSCDEYILYPPDFREIFKEAYEQAKEEVGKIIKEKVMEKAMKDLKESGLINV